MEPQYLIFVKILQDMTARFHLFKLYINFYDKVRRKVLWKIHKSFLFGQYDLNFLYIAHPLSLELLPSYKFVYYWQPIDQNIRIFLYLKW